jgi:hypothetical protein
MKKFRYLLFAALTAGIFTGCDDDTDLPAYQPLGFAQDFDGTDGTEIEIAGWTNFAEAGDALWNYQVYSGNGYAEFNPYQSGDASNVGWLVSPAITLLEDNTNALRFEVSQSYVTSSANKLEVLISTNYDPSTMDPTDAIWTAVNADIPGTDAEYFLFQDSGIISLAPYSGTIHVAFKATGSGTNTSLDGAYQVDSVRIYDTATN